MNGLAAGMARVGDAWDAAVAAAAATPRRVRAALAVRGPRKAGLLGASVTLLLFLISIGDIVVSLAGRWAGAPVFQAAPEGLLRSRAPYLFEPVLAIRPAPYLAFFLSPVNLLLGALMAALVGCNIAVAALAARQAASCRPRSRGYGRLLGALPAFLLGFACCVPTFLLILGTSTAAAVLPFLVPLRPVFYPLTLALLAGTLIWGARRVTAGVR
jgi:hypothetical protein